MTPEFLYLWHYIQWYKMVLWIADYIKTINYKQLIIDNCIFGPQYLLIFQYVLWTILLWYQKVEGSSYRWDLATISKIFGTDFATKAQHSQIQGWKEDVRIN